MKNYLKGSTQSSVLKFRDLETLDTGYFRCEAANPTGDVIKSTSVLKVVFCIVKRTNDFGKRKKRYEQAYL